MVLSILTMRTNFWAPPDDCWMREKERHTVLGACPPPKFRVISGPRLRPPNNQEAQAPWQGMGDEGWLKRVLRLSPP